MPSVKRSIFFCQMVYEDSGRPVTSTDVTAIWNELRTITRNNNHAYLLLGDDERDRVWIDRAGTFPLKLRFGRTRRHGLPQLEGNGELRPIDLDDENEEGINDLFHMVAFGTRGVVAFEYNSRAPRLSALTKYISLKTSSRIRFEFLLNRETAQRLADLQILTSVKLKVRSDYLDNLDTGSADLLRSINGLSEFSTTRELELSFGVASRGDATLSGRLLQAVRRIARNISGEPEDAVSKLKVSGRSEPAGALQHLDLIKQHVVAKKSILASDELTRALNSENAYHEIQNAYAELRDEIRAAVGDDN